MISAQSPILLFTLSANVQYNLEKKRKGDKIANPKSFNININIIYKYKHRLLEKHKHLAY